MKRILITGGAGFIGRNLVSHLRTKGDVVGALDRISMPGKASDCANVDILDYPRLLGALQSFRPDQVVHMAARTDLLGATVADYTANTQGVKNIIAACCECKSIRRVIFASSRMVCRIDHVPSDYEDYCPPNAYGESKVRGEIIVRSSVAPFEWCIVRPTSIWGPGFGIPYRIFFDQVRRRRYFHQSGHSPRKSFGYVGNTVYQVERLLDAPVSKISGRTFYLGDYQPLLLKSWADCIHDEFGLSGRIPTLPMWLLGGVARVGDVVNRLARSDLAPITTFRLNNLVTDMVYPQLSELEGVVGQLPFDWLAGTRQTVSWIKSQ